MTIQSPYGMQERRRESSMLRELLLAWLEMGLAVMQTALLDA